MVRLIEIPAKLEADDNIVAYWIPAEPALAGHERDAALAAKIDYQFGVVQGLLDATKRGDEFVTYDKLTRQQIKALSDAVNALGESLAEVSEVL